MTPDESGAEVSESFDRESPWTESWARIQELEPELADDPLAEFSEEVVEEMQELVNRAELPCVIKASIDVHEGPLNRPNSGDSDE